MRLSIGEYNPNKSRVEFLRQKAIMALYSQSNVLAELPWHIFLYTRELPLLNITKYYSFIVSRRLKMAHISSVGGAGGRLRCFRGLG